MNILLSAATLACLASVGALPRGAAAAPAPGNHIEVVFGTDATLCGGCVPSYTDSMEDPTGFEASYTCPNGDRWTFTEYTPILRSGACLPMPVGCVPTGVCQFTRVGYLTLVGSSQTCQLYAKRKGEARFTQAHSGDLYVIDLAVTCQPGALLTLDCTDDYVEFFDIPNGEDGQVLMAWTVEFCCNRCPS